MIIRQPNLFLVVFFIYKVAYKMPIKWYNKFIKLSVGYNITKPNGRIEINHGNEQHSTNYEFT